MKVLLATEKPFAKKAVNGIRDIIESAGHELILLEKYTQKSELLDAVANVNAIIVRSDKITADVIDAATELKVIVRAGAGYDNIDTARCTEKGIVVMNTPGQNSNAVAELAIAMMIYISRNLFRPGTGSEISGKHLGIIGFGNIGELIAKKAVGLGMEVLVYTNEVKERHQRWNTTFSKDKLYSTCDFVSVNIPATPMTKKSVNYSLISQMPQGACLINTARKELIDEEGLIQALEERPDLKYVTDIAPERYEEMKEKFGDRVFATPKKMGAEYFDLGSTRFQVNK